MSAVTNLAVMFGVMQVAKKIPFEEQPELINYARIAYVTVQLLVVGLFFYCQQKVQAKNDMTVLEYEEPPKPMSNEPPTKVKTTHRDHDLAELSKSIRGVVTGALPTLFMHFYLGYTQPLVVQSVVPLKNALENKEVQIWLWGKAAVGELKRPFAAPPSLFGGAPAAPKPAQAEASATTTATPAAAKPIKATAAGKMSE